MADEYVIHNQYLKVAVSALGAELRSITDCSGTEYLWQGNPEYWTGQAPNIFPTVARLTRGTYRMDGTEYEMGNHGFARRSMFELADRSENAVALVLRDTETTYAQYPRHFTLTIGYRLDGPRLYVDYLVRNTDDRDLHFALGGHPGFNVPLGGGRPFESYRLRFSAPCEPRRIGFTPACFIDGTEQPFPLEDGSVLPLRHDLFDEDAVVLAGTSGEVLLESSEGGPSMKIGYPEMKYLGLWHKPQSDAPYVCIEPWTALPALQDIVTEFDKQPEFFHLSAGGLVRRGWWFELA